MTPSQSQSERDLAFQRWMEEERKIQARQGYSQALAGDTVMDATARLLSSGKSQSAPRPHRETPPKPQHQKQGQAKKPAAKSQAPAPAKPAKPTVKPVSTPKSVQPRPKAAQPAPKPEKRGLFGRKGPKSDAALEERKAQIRQQAKARRARGPVEAPKSDHQMDSTEHASLMKPYYLNDD